MQRKSFNYAVIAEILIGRAELKHLLELSVRHYDSKCRQASSAGGFLHGWAMRFSSPNYSGEEAEPSLLDVSLEERELQTLCKMLEDPGADSIARVWFMHLLKDLHAEHKRMLVPENRFWPEKGKLYEVTASPVQHRGLTGATTLPVFIRTPTGDVHLREGDLVRFNGWVPREGSRLPKSEYELCYVAGWEGEGEHEDVHKKGLLFPNVGGDVIDELLSEHDDV